MKSAGISLMQVTGLKVFPEGGLAFLETLTSGGGVEVKNRELSAQVAVLFHVKHQALVGPWVTVGREIRNGDPHWMWEGHR